jgi:hypothetical protein
METILKRITDPARRLYEAMWQFTDNGVCKANQRQLIAATSMAFKTLIPARDELVRVGLCERYVAKRGRRDWYRMNKAEEIDRRVAAAEAEARKRTIVDQGRHEASVSLAFSFDEPVSG